MDSSSSSSSDEEETRLKPLAASSEDELFHIVDVRERSSNCAADDQIFQAHVNNATHSFNSGQIDNEFEKSEKNNVGGILTAEYVSHRQLHQETNLINSNIGKIEDETEVWTNYSGSSKKSYMQDAECQTVVTGDVISMTLYHTDTKNDKELISNYKVRNTEVIDCEHNLIALPEIEYCVPSISGNSLFPILNNSNEVVTNVNKIDCISTYNSINSKYINTGSKTSLDSNTTEEFTVEYNKTGLAHVSDYSNHTVITSPKSCVQRIKRILFAYLVIIVTAQLFKSLTLYTLLFY